MAISWGRIYLSLAALAAVAIVVGFVLKYLGIWVTV
jgi:hypothetical protein